MIDTDKYEGHTPAPWRGQVDTDEKTEFDEYGSVWKGKDVIALVDDQACDEMFPDADLNLIADAPLLLEEVKQIHEILREAFSTEAKYSGAEYLNMIARVTGLIE